MEYLINNFHSTICVISYHIWFRFNGENESKYESGDQSFDSRSNSTKIEIQPIDNNLDGKYKGSGGSDGEGSGEDKFNYQFISNEQGNQLKVENPADFKNGEWNGSSFEKSKSLNGVNVNGIQGDDSVELEPPALPTRGILKRAKIENNKNEDKNGI